MPIFHMHEHMIMIGKVLIKGSLVIFKESSIGERRGKGIAGGTKSNLANI